MSDYRLPDVGEGLTEAELVSWRVEAGDEVAVNDIVCEIETAKSVVELPSPYAGRVVALLVQPGETVAVGTAIITIADAASATGGPTADGGAPATVTSAVAVSAAGVAGSAGAGSAQTAGLESLVGRARAEGGPTRRPRRVPAGAPAPRDPAQVRALAKPPVRKLAKDLGVDLETLAGTGAHGTVSRADVERAGAPRVVAAPGAAVAAGTVPAGRRETREPVTGVGRTMAAAMTASAFTAPHVTEWVTVDATATVELVDRLRTRSEFRDVRVSPLLVLARAVLLAMRRTPIVNSTWDEAAGEVVTKHYVNLGIAADTPRGLVVPNVKDAHDLALLELATALAELTATARAGRTQPAQMAGGTFTITNIGVFGIDAGTPIINPGESAILAFGAIRAQPWVVTRDGVEQLAVRQVTTLALSFDHRHVDGAAGSRFLADVAGIVADPATALLF